MYSHLCVCLVSSVLHTSMLGRFVWAPQGISSNLPTNLQGAAQRCTRHQTSFWSRSLLKRFCLPDKCASLRVHFGDRCVLGFKLSAFEPLCVFCIHSAGSAESRLHRLLAYLTVLLSSLISPVNAGLQLIENELACVSLQCLCKALVKGAHTLCLKENPPTVCKE